MQYVVVAEYEPVAEESESIDNATDILLTKEVPDSVFDKVYGLTTDILRVRNTTEEKAQEVIDWLTEETEPQEIDVVEEEVEEEEVGGPE